MRLIVSLVCLFTVTVGVLGDESSSTPAWGYSCINNSCQKTELSDANLKTSVSLSVCRLYCNGDFGTLWPYPTGNFQYGNNLVHLDINQIFFSWHQNHGVLVSYWMLNEIRMKKQLGAKIHDKSVLKDGGQKLLVDISVKTDSLDLNLNTDESYKLEIRAKDGVTVKIEAENYYGARHAIETLSQLIVFDDIRNELLVAVDVVLSDGPVYKYRGVALDTSRNYVTLDGIKRTIDGLAMVKMNVFHWHITDSQSFPVVIKSQPHLNKYGAYSSHEIYTAEDVEDIAEYARMRGVRVIPEFDAPAHVGEGWQNTNLTTCFNIQPWDKYCVEPPCGQLDPTKDKLYDVLEDIYREMNGMFKYADMFHMGGDEVSIKCWNTSSDIQKWMTDKGWGLEEADFMKLWGHFQDNALLRLDKVINDKTRPIILWTSTLTDIPYLEQYVDKERYIVQVWTLGNDPKVTHLLERGYKLIISNYDALYLDCGFGGWVTEGNNWCAPYIGWHKVYDNDLAAIGGEHKNLILGGEAALWTEQADTLTLDSRLWPRLSALAERLWTDPNTGWKKADSRMVYHRERLVENGKAAESIQPKWCLQNEGECPIGSSSP